MTWAGSILRVHGGMLAALGTLLFGRALVGRLHGTGIFAFLADNQVASIGFLEAYGLIALAGVALALGASAPRRRPLHLVAAGLHVFLTAINVVHWQFYALLGMQAAGYAATVMHVVLAAVELVCAAKPGAACVTVLHGREV